MKRITFVDYLRVTACFVVMLVHACEYFYCIDAESSYIANESNRLWVAIYDGGLGRISVPLFMIMSAFLLVPMRQDQSMTQFYKKRFGRILPPFVLFLILYATLPLLWGGMTVEQSLADLKMVPFNFPSMAGHLWFMYPLISLYLFIPIISPWLERASAKDERIFLGLFAFTTCLPWLHRWVSPDLWGECIWNRFSMFWYCSGFIGYLVLAHYVRVHLHWERQRKLMVGTACAIAGAAFTAWSFWLEGVPGSVIPTPDVEWSWQFCTLNVLVATFGVFLLFSCIERKEAPSFITQTAPITYGMYLMHIFYLQPIAMYIVTGDPTHPLIHVSIAIPLIAVLTFACCWITTKLIAFLPGSKWLVGV